MKQSDVISNEKFSALMEGQGIDWDGENKIAVAVSGGGDSMALAVLLAEWAAAQGIKLHALTVNHGLRSEAAAEAKFVAKTLKPLDVIHKTLVWEGEKPKTRIQEAARDARYRLMTEYCIQKGIKYLFVAHHGNDQMETILFRMAKGTGLDGLAGMRPVQKLEGGLVLVRPLLSVSHDALILTCKDRKIDWIEDPSNENNRYARVRIRSIIEILEKEGMTPDRISSLSDRLLSSIELIDYLIEDKYKSIELCLDTERIDIKYNDFLCLPFEGKVRILRRMIDKISPKKKYPARLEDIERLAVRMNENFRGATLGGCQFKRKKERLVILQEV